jgi:hypothetical protein
MNIVGLDGKSYKWQLSQYMRESTNASSYHEKVRGLLKEIFPTQIVLEEVTLPGSGTSNKDMLFADFFLPHRRLLIEIHGRQHYEHVGLFHGTDVSGKINFYKGQQRDRNKKEWCAINNITFLELSYKEDESVWRSKICNS